MRSFSTFQSAWFVDVFIKGAKTAHALRRLLLLRTSQVEAQGESQVDGAEACLCRHQEDVHPECDQLGEGGGGVSRREALQDSARCQEERGQGDLREHREPQQQPDLHGDQRRAHRDKDLADQNCLTTGKTVIVSVTSTILAFGTWLSWCLVTKQI